MQPRHECAPDLEPLLFTLGGDWGAQESEDLSAPPPPPAEDRLHVYIEEDRITLMREGPESGEPEASPSLPTEQRASAALSSLFLLLLLAGGLVVVFAPQPRVTHAFTVTVPGFGLTPVHQRATVQAQATGKGFLAATVARGLITFYNGQPYTQLIPAGTILTGRDGVQVIAEEQASIPPVAQTLPPTDGAVTVSAHALLAGAASNIGAGDINQPCCVTSVIAQNPSPFSGGHDAQHFLYVSKQDVSGATVPLLARLQAQAPRLFASTLILSPRCTPTISAIPAIGQRASRVRVTVTVSCSALSYHPQDVQQAIEREGQRLGPGRLTAVSAQVVSIDRQEQITLYVSAIWNPTALPAAWFHR